MRKWHENNIALGRQQLCAVSRFSLRQAVSFFDRGVDLAFSQIGGKHFGGFHFWVLRQLLEAFAFLFRL